MTVLSALGKGGSMAKGISIHVGVNKTQAPGIIVPELKGCVNDAVLMSEIAVKKGFEGVTLLLNEDATYDRVFHAIEGAAGELKKGDFFLFTFSGHGTRRGALFSGEEDDGKDETIVLHDRIFIDNVFKFLLWPKFDKDVRIFAVSDSCHSDGVFFVSEDTGDELEVNGSAVVSAHSLKADGPIEEEIVSNGSGQFRTISRSQAKKHIELLSEFYKPLVEKIAKAKAEAANSLGSSPLSKLLFLAACEADKETRDDFPLGVFTQALKEVWNEGTFPGNYSEFRKAIDDKLPDQTPALGPDEQDAEFVAQRPFTITI
jgi:metacaspase-1